MSDKEEKKRIVEALASEGDDKSIKHLEFLVKLYNHNIGMTNHNLFLSFGLNSEFMDWIDDNEEYVYSEKLTATLYFDRKPYFVAWTEHITPKRLTPKQRKEKLNSECILLLLAMIKYGIDAERENPLYLYYFRGKFQSKTLSSDN